MTVAEAVATDIEARDARRSIRAGRARHSDAYYSLNRYVLEDTKLPCITLAALAEGDLRAWQLRIARKKPSSVQRVVNDFKAAVNYAFEMHRKVLTADLPVTIKFAFMAQRKRHAGVAWACSVMPCSTFEKRFIIVSPAGQRSVSLSV